MWWCALVVVPVDGDLKERVREAMQPLDGDESNWHHVFQGGMGQEVVTALKGVVVAPAEFLSGGATVPDQVFAVVVHGSGRPFLPTERWDGCRGEWVRVCDAAGLTRMLRIVLAARCAAGMTDRVVVVSCHW